MAPNAFHSSANYRSVVAHGSGRILEDDEHRLPLDVIVEKLIPGRLADLRSPRFAPVTPHDDPDDLGSDVWDGVIPVKLTWEEPIATADLDHDQPVPPYLSHYRR